VAALSAELTHLHCSSRDPHPISRKRRLGPRPPPKVTLHSPSSSTIAAAEPGLKIYTTLCLRPPIKANKADINGGTCRHGL
jgi:hypothetical protein